MSNRKSKQILFASAPEGMPDDSTFQMEEVDLPAPQAGEFLVRNVFMSVDPYMRGRMTTRKSYVAGFQLGKPLEGGAIGQVVESENEKFPVGSYVQSMLGWREAYVTNGEMITPVDPNVAPLSSYLGVLGMPGLTAYAGLNLICQPKEGETIFVSAASGAVGSVVCQLAKAKGVTVIGSAGSDDKIDWLKNEAGVDEAINYKKADNLSAELAKLAPKGIDMYFDNVGSEHLDAALFSMNDFGRIAVCGMIDQYNATNPSPVYNMINTVPRRILIKGFIVSDHFDLLGDFISEVGPMIKSGQVKFEETIFEGVENAPKAFMGLFSGANKGKMLVRLGPDQAV